jgi:hypothetical protein
MRSTLILISIVAGLSYIGLMATALIASHGDVPLRKLSRAVRLYGWAIAAARQRRGLKAERVQVDAERTVRDWRGDLW